MPFDRVATLAAISRTFREHGYEGASLALITRATGLGKGSLYNAFPGGKEEMLASVLDDIDGWFEANVFARLRASVGSGADMDGMFDAVDAYFRSGCRTCLVGALALTEGRDRFGSVVNAYFTRWIEALAGALERAGRTQAAAASLAEEVVSGIQGAIVLSRAVNDPAAFGRILAQLRARVRHGG